MGKPSVDFFDSRLSHQLPWYMSWKLDPFWQSKWMPCNKNGQICSHIRSYFQPRTPFSWTLKGQPSRATHRIRELKTSGMVNFKQQMEADGISEKAEKLITNARRQGTQARYESAWNKWVSWCTQRQIDPFWCSVKFVANFLADLFETGLEYRTLNSYRSSISAFHKTGHSILTGRHPLVTPLMKETGNSRPPTPRYNFIWNKEQVLKYISSLPPNSKLSLNLLILELVMLPALASMSRSLEIKNLDTIFLTKSKNKAVFSLKGFTKTSKPGKQPPDVIFYSFAEN